jgi:cytochrome c-type protein NapB
MKAYKLVAMIALLGLSVGVMATSVPEEKIATFRLAPLNIEPTPPAMQKVVNNDVKQVRSYPMQPPIIPHKIDGYQIDLKVNKCIQCHSRTSGSSAPMVSVTHYMDRDNNFLTNLSPRRYFCTQCHAPQLDAKLLVENDFIDIEQLIKAKAAVKH